MSTNLDDNREDLDLYPERPNLFQKIHREARYLLHLYRQWRCERARAYLLKHDFDYQFQQSNKDLVRRREEAREKGIGPMDPEYPDRDFSQFEETLKGTGFPRAVK